MDLVSFKCWESYSQCNTRSAFSLCYCWWCSHCILKIG